MTAAMRNIQRLWRQIDPSLRLFVCVFLMVFLWRLSIAILAFPGVQYNLSDYIWMTKFFGMSDLMFAALVFTGFGIIPSLSNAIFFAFATGLAAWVCIRARVSARRATLILSFAAVVCVAMSTAVGPSLQMSLAVLTGAPLPGLISFIGEFLIGLIIIQAMAAWHIKDMRRRKRPAKRDGRWQ